MPLSKNNQPAIRQLFWTLIGVSLMLWVIYRSLFSFPVWFDETIGKALFMGFPVWFFANLTKNRQICQSLAMEKIYAGLLRGLAIGGMFGFVAAVTLILTSSSRIEPVGFFTVDQFWWEFLLAMLTAFWETVFFFSFIQPVLRSWLPKKYFWRPILITAGLFLVFHLPNMILRFSGIEIVSQIFLTALFGLGQALLMTGSNNAYLLMMTHTLWGMVLLVHF